MAMKTKYPTVIPGATGMVPQRFIQLLARDSWFEIGVLAATA
jgi:aspartate-semialdehyde dehydrogenase